MSDATFACGECGGTFPKGWSDEERDAEALEIFGNIPVTERVVVCDDCYQAMMSWGAEAGVDPKESHSGGPV